MAERPPVGLHRLAVLTAACTLVLLFIGGLVTSTGSGLAVPDWPLSFGQVFPPMVGGVLFEHSHRLAAAAVGFLTLVLALWMVLRESRPGVRVLALVALFAVILQGVLGGVTVLYKLPLAVSVTHACLAQLFFCLTVTLAAVTGRDWLRARTPLHSSVQPALPLLAAATTTLVFCQLVLGAVMRHLGAGLAIPDFPLAFGRVIPPLVTPHITVHFAHRLGALVVTGAVGWTVARVLRRHRDEPTLRRPALGAVALLVLQITLGALTIWSQRAVIPTTAHLAVGASLLATCLVIALRAGRIVAWRAATTVPAGLRRAVA
jgi:cytochrome c oxidase assembly protein subunit 15